MPNHNLVSPERPLRIAFVLPGLHRVCRGAEVAFESIASSLASMPATEVTLLGSGFAREDDRYSFLHVPSVSREHFERFPRMPILRSEYAWEELTFLPALATRFSPAKYDVTVTCSYPFTNWFLRAIRLGKKRPAHVFVTQNGDHAVSSRKSEYCFFSCDGLVCTNPEYMERNSSRWRSRLIPNGVNVSMFKPGSPDRAAHGLPPDAKIVLMVSALIPSKRVADGIRAVAQLRGCHLLVCGDGPEREAIRSLGTELLGERFQLRQVPRALMPAVYQCADVFLHMSIVEASANAYIEALATGLPVVTHDRQVTRWTLEDSGVLVDTTDLSRVGSAITQAFGMKNPADINARRQLAERRFSWDTLALQYRDFFSDIVSP